MSDFFDTIQGTQASDPCARFLSGMLETVNFVFFVTDLATRADQMRSIAAKALADTATGDAEQERHRSELDTDEKIITNRLRSFRQTIFQMLISLDPPFSPCGGVIGRLGFGNDAGLGFMATSAFLQGLLFGKLGRFCLFASRARLRGAAGVR